MIKVLIIYISALLCLTQCSNKLTAQADHSKLNITHSHFNKTYPGVEDMQPMIELHLVMENDANNIKIDSILFKGLMSAARTYKHEGKQNTKVEIPLSAVKPNAFDSVPMKDNDALIFYNYKNKQYFHHLKNIKESEALYLP